ncbi:MAG: hypothetical protein CMB79_00545 [Filomicrobium sp.]|nr:hypothetical protein [Filomicrobium sp.]
MSVLRKCGFDGYCRPAASSQAPVSDPLIIFRGLQIVAPLDLMIGDAAENICQLCLRIDAVDFGRFNHRLYNRR